MTIKHDIINIIFAQVNPDSNKYHPENIARCMFPKFSKESIDYVKKEIGAVNDIKLTLFSISNIEKEPFSFYITFREENRQTEEVIFDYNMRKV